MKSYRIEQEHPDHFVVHDGESSFKVAKPRLAHSTVERIRKFAKGGEVTDEQIDPMSGAPYGLPPISQELIDQAPLGMLKGLGLEPPPPASAPATQGPPEGIARPEGAFADGTPPPVIPAAAVAPGPSISPTQGLGGMPGAAGQIAAAGKQGAAALQAEGQAKAIGFADIAAKEEAGATHLQEMQQQGEQQLAQRLQRQEQLFQAIQEQKIDPNRYWNSQSTGQKIGASIGLILGGIGAGLTHGPNYALEVIEKSINRDMESQRLELGKKENLLGHYMQQTRDLQAAQHMARADYLNGVAAQIQAATSRMSGATAIPAAQAAIATLKAQSVEQEQAAIARTQQIQQGNLSLQQGQVQVEALRGLLKGVGGGGGFDRRILEMPGFEKYRERAVDMPDGSVAFAKDKEEATKASESFQTVGRLKSKLQRLRDMLNSGNPITTDRGAAAAIRTDLLAEMGHLHDLNRLSDIDLKMFEQQVPDLTDLVKPNAAKKLDALGKAIDDKSWQTNKTLLHLPNARRPNA